MSENHIDHPTPKKYVQIAIILGILTAIEIALYYTCLLYTSDAADEE